MGARNPVTGWKAALLVIGAIIAFFLLANVLGHRYLPQPERTPPSPTIIR